MGSNSSSAPFLVTSSLQVLFLGLLNMEDWTGQVLGSFLIPLSINTLSRRVGLLFKSLLIFYSQKSFPEPAQYWVSLNVLQQVKTISKAPVSSGEETWNCLERAACQQAAQHLRMCVPSSSRNKCGVSSEHMHSIVWAKVGEWMRTPALHHPSPLETVGCLQVPGGHVTIMSPDVLCSPAPGRANRCHSQIGTWVSGFSCMHIHHFRS